MNFLDAEAAELRVGLVLSRTQAEGEGGEEKDDEEGEDDEG